MQILWPCMTDRARLNRAYFVSCRDKHDPQLLTAIPYCQKNNRPKHGYRIQYLSGRLTICLSVFQTARSMPQHRPQHYGRQCLQLVHATPSKARVTMIQSMYPRTTKHGEMESCSALELANPTQSGYALQWLVRIVQINIFQTLHLICLKQVWGHRSVYHFRIYFSNQTERWISHRSPSLRPP